MKRLISLLTIFVALNVNAQVIHWITFIDTKDPYVGDCDKIARKVLYGHFINAVNDVLTEKGYKPVIHDYYDDSLSPENCVRVVKELPCASNDIIVFYYIGHGTHGIIDHHQYPQMQLGLTLKDESKFIPLKWVHEQLKAKNPALVVTIGMCCNDFDGASAKEGPTFNVSYGNRYYTETEKQAIQELFLGYKGDIIVASASPGQKSYACSTQFGYMDYFTAVFVYNFETSAQDGGLEWDTLLQDVKEIVHQNRQHLIYSLQQTPVYSLDLYNIKKDIYIKVSEYTDQELFDKLNDGFAKLLDRNILYKEKRERIIPSLLTLFSPDAFIKTVGNDGKTVVDIDKADEFIRRMATTVVPMKVTLLPDAIKKSSNNSITELKVKIKKL